MILLIPLFSSLIACIFLFFILQGAPPFPSYKEAVKRLVEIAEVKPGERAADLGSGDGRLVIALAQAGAEAHGYEINPLLIWLARNNIRQAGLSTRAFIHWRNFWSENLSSYHIVVVFGTPHIMKFLEKKLKRELRPGAKVISVYFAFPNWPYLRKEKEVYLYFRQRGKNGSE